MKPLSKEASDALSALKATDPTAADEARVRKNLERALGIVIPAASVAVATTAVTAQAATGASVSSGVTAMSLGAKAVAFVFAVGVSSVVTVTVVRRALAPAPATPAQKTLTVVAPQPVVVARAAAPEIEVTVEAEPVVAPQVKAAPVEEVAVAQTPRPVELAAVIARARPAAPSAIPEPVAAPQAAAATVGVAPPAEPEFSPPPAPPNTQESYEQEIETNFPNCDPGTEKRSALNARKLLIASRAEEAVGLLGAYQKRCPSGRWSDEAWSVRLAGLCMLGRNAEVIGLLQWFSNESPERRASVVTGLRSWCSEEVLKHGEPAGE